MSIALPQKASARGLMSWGVLGLGLVLMLGNVAWMVGRVRSEPAAVEAVSQTPEPTASPGTVTLAEGKLKSIKLETEKVDIVSMPAELGVPGRIEANLEKQVPIRPRAAGVIRTVNVTLGQSIKKGQLLAVLDSPDVGTERLNLRAKQRALHNARYDSEWKKTVADNVATLIPELRKRTDATILLKSYLNRPLGAFFANLMTAYTEFDIASHEEEKTGALRKREIVGEHPAFVATHTREGAQAKFEAVLSQAKFDAEQQSRLSDQQVSMAEGEVIDAAQRLRILGVDENIKKLLEDPGMADLETLANEDVTAYAVNAPFDGTIIARNAVQSQKAEINDDLFTIADLSTVWVQVNVPESDFALLPELEHGRIRLTATAYPDRTFEARLLSIGATVDPTTRTVPMLAQTSNSENLLKIGMFVRIILDTTVVSKALTVPTSAVVEIEGKPGVFVPTGTDGTTFTFRPIKVGRLNGHRTLVASGLALGETVVSSGAFDLKSELILQNDTEEE